MPRKIVLISGSVASGKSTLVRGLQSEFDDVHVVKTKTIIQDLARKKLGRELRAERRTMQQFGNRLDRETKGGWVRDALRRELARLGVSEPKAIVVVDAVRITDQIAKIRDAYGYSVVHVHLRAPEEVLAERYQSRSSGLTELPSFSDVAQDATEARIERLERVADIVIDTKLSQPDDVLARAAASLGLYYPGRRRSVDVLVGAQFGSEGKGHIASYLAREYQVLVRVGGPNAGHSVYMTPRPYVHRQLPSGTTRNPLATLVIGPGAVLNVKLLLKEIADCKVESGRLFIDPQAMVISEKDIASEHSLRQRISSTGQGVGLAAARRIADRGRSVKLAGDIKELRPYTTKSVWEILDKAHVNDQRILLEGTQGTGLSIFHGLYPYVTSRDTTASGCLSEAGIPPLRVRRVVLVCRTYPIRVPNAPDGRTSGPWDGSNIREDITWQLVSTRSGIPIGQLLETEQTSVTKHLRRVGEFNWAQLRHAAVLNGATDIALTFADYLSADNDRARRYEQLDLNTIRFIEEVERVAAAPVSLISTRFDFRSIIDRRTW